MEVVFASDSLLAGFGLPELKVMLDIALENQPVDGVTVCEVGAGTGGLTKQVTHPLTDRQE